MLGLEFGYFCRKVVGAVLCLAPIGLIDLHLLLGVLDALFGFLDHLHEVFAFLFPVALEHVDDSLGVLVHQSRGLVSELCVDSIFLLLVHLDMGLILLIVLPVGNVLILAEGVHKCRGLAKDIVVIAVRAKSALD